MEVSFNITHYVNINVQMVLGVRYCSNFKVFRDVSLFNKEILDTSGLMKWIKTACLLVTYYY